MRYLTKKELLESVGKDGRNTKWVDRMIEKGNVIEERGRYILRRDYEKLQRKEEIKEGEKLGLEEENKKLKMVLANFHTYIYNYLHSMDPMIDKESLRRNLNDMIKASKLEEDVKIEIKVMQSYSERNDIEKIRQDNRKLRQAVDYGGENTWKFIKRKMRNQLPDEIYEDFLNEYYGNLGITDEGQDEFENPFM